MKTSQKISFNHSYKSLFIWFLCTYLIFGPILSLLRDFTFTGNVIESLSEYSLHDILVKINSLMSFFLFMCLSYLVFYRYFPRKKLRLFVGMVLVLFLPIVLRFFIDQKLLFWLFGETNYLIDTSFKFYFSDNTYFAVYYIPSGILYYFYKRNQALQVTQLEAERLRSEAEMTHLRSQINPHFLFNSLNNIYSLAYEKSDKILGAIEGLSGVLRYALYEKSEFVTFNKEWEKVLQLIQIEQMRLLNPVDFNIQLEDDISYIMIPPVILLPIIENVFKHGDVQDKNNPPLIEAYSKNSNLIIRIKNKVSNSIQKDGQHGIGIENIKKRLNHSYGNDASFEVVEKEDTFIAQMSIPI